MRNLKRYLTAACVAVAGIMAAASPADACSCVALTCGSIAAAENVFEATVVSVERTAGDSASSFGRAKMVTLKDIRSLRGDARAIIFTGNNDEDCGFTFRPGERYLIDAGRSEDGRFTTSICSFTRSIHSAAQAIAYLEALKRSPGEMRVWGSVSRITGWPGYDGYTKPISGAEVTIAGPTRVTMSTDGNGRFVAAGLPAGRYAVTARINGKVVPADESWSAFVLHKEHNPCEVLAIGLQPSGRVQGSVVSDDGSPLGDIEIDVISADLRNATGHRPGFSDTFSQGRFLMDELPPGRYVVSVNPRRGPVEDNPYFEAETQPFVVEDGRTALAPTLRVRRATMVDIAGELRDDDGRPMSNVQLDCRMELRDVTRPCRPQGVKTDASGRFAIRLWRDQRYLISIGPDYAPLAWMHFTADGRPLIIRARQQ